MNVRREEAANCAYARSLIVVVVIIIIIIVFFAEQIVRYADCL